MFNLCMDYRFERVEEIKFHNYSESEREEDGQCSSEDREVYSPIVPCGDRHSIVTIRTFISENFLFQIFESTISQELHSRLTILVRTTWSFFEWSEFIIQHSDSPPSSVIDLNIQGLV